MEGYLLIYLIVLVVVFLICREIVCWYWKIDKRLEVLKSIDNKLSYLMPDAFKQDKIKKENEINKKPVIKKYDSEYWRNYNKDK